MQGSKKDILDMAKRVSIQDLERNPSDFGHTWGSESEDPPSF